MTDETQYLRIKIDTAPKTSLNATGGVTYAVLKDAASTEAYFCLLANDGGGYFSREAVPFSAIEACLSGVNTERSIPAKVFRQAFVGKSVNNAGFLVHALRHEELLKPAPDAAHQHFLGEGWGAWKADMLAQAGEPFELPDAKKEGLSPPVVTAAVSDSGKKGRKVRKTALAGSPADTTSEPGDPYAAAS